MSDTSSVIDLYDRLLAAEDERARAKIIFLPPDPERPACSL